MKIRNVFSTSPPESIQTAPRERVNSDLSRKKKKKMHFFNYDVYRLVLRTRFFPIIGRFIFKSREDFRVTYIPNGCSSGNGRFRCPIVRKRKIVFIFCTLSPPIPKKPLSAEQKKKKHDDAHDSAFFGRAILIDRSVGRVTRYFSLFHYRYDTSTPSQSEIIFYTRARVCVVYIACARVIIMTTRAIVCCVIFF